MLNVFNTKQKVLLKVTVSVSGFSLKQCPADVCMKYKGIQSYMFLHCLPKSQSQTYSLTLVSDSQLLLDTFLFKSSVTIKNNQLPVFVSLQVWLELQSPDRMTRIFILMYTLLLFVYL